MPSLVPFDYMVIESVKKTGRIVITGVLASGHHL